MNDKLIRKVIGVWGSYELTPTYLHTNIQPLGNLRGIDLIR